MSAGLRIPLRNAEAAAELVMSCWFMRTPASAVVGSVRRKRPDVGDLELISPLPPAGKADWLVDRIQATVPVTGALWSPNADRAFTEVLEGLKPGFKECRLRVQLKVVTDNQIDLVPVQIFRYEEGDQGNRGWIELMRTGPRDFGISFLAAWKRRYGIAQTSKASVDGHLVDQWGKRVPTPTEAAAFAACGIPHVPPEERDDPRNQPTAILDRNNRETMR